VNVSEINLAGASDSMAIYTILSSAEAASNLARFTPLIVSSDLVKSTRLELLKLPQHREIRLEHSYGLNANDSVTLCQNPELVGYFEDTVSLLVKYSTMDLTTAGTLACTWIPNSVLQVGTKQGLAMTEFPVTTSDSL